MNWPNNKEFAFTVIDDTDNATVDNINAVYKHLYDKNIITTKTIWVYPSRDRFTGQTIDDEIYLKFLLDLEDKGFEIQLHNVGSGDFKRKEIIDGLEKFKSSFNRYPSMHINHSSNSDNIYWGFKRYGFILKTIIKLVKGKKREFYGDDINSDFFWGDHSKKHIKYIRNRVFNGVNTLKYDPKMPFKEKNKPYSNYWFSSSDGHTIEEFNDLISKENIDKLKQQKGLCIVYTHFASDFVNSKGELNQTFKNRIDYLSKQNGWFAPASEILDYLTAKQIHNKISSFYVNVLDVKWVINRIIKKIKYKR